MWNKEVESDKSVPDSKGEIEMDKWEGWVESGDLRMNATIEFRQSYSNKMGKLVEGEWYGRGVSDRPWPYKLLDPNFIETNVGQIRILKQIQDRNELFIIEFKGNGEPKGLLADTKGRQGVSP